MLLGEHYCTSITKLPKTESIKRMIRVHKNGPERIINPATASEIHILERYRVTPKGESFLLFDSGVGDNSRIIIFATPKMFSILRDSQRWYADGTFKVVPQQFNQLNTLHAEKNGTTYDRISRKLLEIEPALNPTHIMVDFEKTSINALEEHFLAEVSGCFFHFFQNIFRKIQLKGLTNQYMEDFEFAVTMRMLPSLAFVPEHDVSDCFLILMADFPQCAVEIAEYFEETYIGKRLPDQTRRIPTFPIRMWNMHHRVIDKTARTNNAVEGWHNAFQSSISCSHPSFPKFVKLLQREQGIQDV